MVDAYEPPKSDVSKDDEKTKKKWFGGGEDDFDVEVIKEDAYEKLVKLWKIKLAFNFLVFLILLYNLLLVPNLSERDFYLYIIMGVLLLVESLCAIFFMWKRSDVCSVILIIYAILYLFSFPLGTIFAFFHFKYCLSYFKSAPKA